MEVVSGGIAGTVAVVGGGGKLVGVGRVPGDIKSKNGSERGR